MKEEPRYIYKKDEALCRTGITDFAEARETAEKLSDEHSEPEFRIRTRLRSRTGLWDVVVKRRTEVKAEAKS